MSEKIMVKGDADKLAYYNWQLEKLGLSEESEDVYSGQFDSEEELSNVVNFCIRNELEYSYDNDYAGRSYSYRSEFFKNNPPNAKGKYRCVYCGKWFDEDRIQVDHIYPVSRVAADHALQTKLKNMGINDVNALQNLAPACEACNNKKGNSIGSWPRKAKRGMKDSYWIWRASRKWIPVLILALIALFFYFNPIKVDNVEMQQTIKDIFRWMMGL